MQSLFYFNACSLSMQSNQMSRPPLQEIHVIVTNALDNMPNMLQFAPDIRTITIAIPQMEVTLIFEVTVIATNAIGSDEGTTIQVTVGMCLVLIITHVSLIISNVSL